MAPCSVTAAPSPSSPRSPDSAPDITPSPPSSETRNKVDRVTPARSCHKLRLASAHSPSKSVSGFLASAEPTASAFCPARRFRIGRPDTPANPVLCSSPPLSSCRVYPESPKIKTPISAGVLQFLAQSRFQYGAAYGALKQQEQRTPEMIQIQSSNAPTHA